MAVSQENLIAETVALLRETPRSFSQIEQHFNNRYYGYLIAEMLAHMVLANIVVHIGDDYALRSNCELGNWTYQSKYPDSWTNKEQDIIMRNRPDRDPLPTRADESSPATRRLLF